MSEEEIAKLFEPLSNIVGSWYKFKDIINNQWYSLEELYFTGEY